MSKILRIRNDKNTIHLLGQKISVEQKALKVGDSNDFSNGFTPFEGELPDEMRALCVMQGAFWQ